MKTILVRVGFLIVPLSLANVTHSRGQSGTRPAMVTSGADSVAAFLHYPPKAKAAKVQTAIPFYCEVGANGKAAHMQLYGPKDKGEFRKALLAALTKGRFQPAMSEGKTVPVMLGGTALFAFHGDEPIIALSLATANKQKIAALGNYIQPQMLTSSAEFRRKIMKARFDPDIHLRAGEHPGAMAMVEVDAQGNLVSAKVAGESLANGGWGPLLLKGFKGARFIPALSDGKPVAGEFDLTVNYEFMADPDYGPEIGSHINRDDYDR